MTMPPNVLFLLTSRPFGCKMTSEHGKASVLPAHVGMQAEALFHRSSDLIFLFLLKGVDFIMTISIKVICFGSLLVHSVFLPVPHVSLPHSA